MYGRNQHNVVITLQLKISNVFKSRYFEVLSSLTQQQWTISQSDCDIWWKVDFIQQPAQWLYWEEAPKHFPKSNLHPKKDTATVRWSAAPLIHYSFLNPGKTITSEKYAQQIDKMHWKLQCLQTALINKMGTILLQDNTRPHFSHQCFKSWRNWAMKFASSANQTWPLANWLPLLKHLHNFLQGKCFHNQQEAKNAFQEFVESQSMQFYAKGINLFLIGKKICWL